MLDGWARVWRYTQDGWRHCSTRFTFLLIIGIAAFSAWNSAPFWVTFSSLIPFVFLSFPLVGFVLEILDKDWNDWHLW